MEDFPVPRLIIGTTCEIGGSAAEIFLGSATVCGATVGNRSDLVWLKLHWASSGLMLRSLFAGLKPVFLV